MREINGHWVHGRVVKVEDAHNEREARIFVNAQIAFFDESIWEIKETSPGTWEAYVARHEDCFATND